MAAELYFKEIIRSEEMPFSLDENGPRTSKESKILGGISTWREWYTGNTVWEEDIYNNE